MELLINELHKSFGVKKILDGVSLIAKSGTCTGIIGKNGCGKSTLLSVIAGISRADSGEILCNGERLSARDKHFSDIIAYVPQGTPLMPELSAWDNLLLWYKKPEILRLLDSGVLGELGIGEFLKTPVNKMSGGMKKRLSIGCAVSKDPPVLLLDEPTAALDLPCRQVIYNYLEGCKKSGKLIILTTHTESEFSLCDELNVLKNGKLERVGFEGDINKLVAML